MPFGNYTLEEVKQKQGAKRLRTASKPRKATKPRVALKKRSKVAKSKPKGKVKTQAQLKKELDKYFSLYIRKINPHQCYTCGKTEGLMQCGHFVSRQYLATRWDENNCRPQCWGCNGFGGGKPLDFEERLKKELGAELVENMKASRHQMLKLDRNWYVDKIKYYQGLLVE